MFTIPDFSYFAVSGFIPKMRSYNDRTSSLILHNKSDDQWDSVLRQEDAYLITWLHNKTGEIHNVYFPYAPNKRFLSFNSEHIIDIIEPAKRSIKHFLSELGVDDVEEYMRDSDEWLSVLFSLGHHHNRAAEIASSFFQITSHNFPVILVWSNLESRTLIKIIPNSSDENITEYVKSLYWSITMATRDLAGRERTIPIDKLLKGIQGRLEQSHHVKDYEQKIQSIEILRTNKTIARTLEDIGEAYKNEFNDAILNFEDIVKNDSAHESIIQITDESKNKIIKILIESGFSKVREGDNHEIWQHPNLTKPTPLPRHRSLSNFVIRSIEKDIQLATSA